MKPPPSSFAITNKYDPNQALPRDLLLLILRYVNTLRDFASCMRTSKLFYNFCNREESWMSQLRLCAEREFQGRSEWAGYQLKPIFLDAEWDSIRGGPIACGPNQQRTFDLLAVSRKDLFSMKRMIRERFDLFRFVTVVVSCFFWMF